MTLFEGEIKYSDFRSILDPATVLVNECRVFFEDEIHIRGTDPADVAVVSIHISEGVFSDPTIGSGNVCFDFKEVIEMAKVAGESTDISITIQDHDIDLEVLDLSFNISLIDPDTLKRDRPIPDLDLTGEVALESSAFQRGVNAADLIADEVEFGINEAESAFYMIAKGDTNEVIMERKKQDLLTLSSAPISSTYRLDYLKAICEPIPEGTRVRLLFDQDHPAEISYEILDGNATVNYLVAPKVEPDA